MAYTPFKMRGNPMKRNFGIGATPAKMKKSPMKKDDKTLVAKSDSMDVAHDKFMKDRMKVLQNKAQKSADSLQTVRKKVINKAVDKKTEAIAKEDSRSKQKKMTSDLGKEIKALNEKRSGVKMMKKSPSKMKKSAMKLKKAPTKFNKGLKAAAAAGKLDKNPKFKAAVENAPAKMKKSAMKMKKSAMKLKKSPTKMGHKKK